MAGQPFHAYDNIISNYYENRNHVAPYSLSGPYLYYDTSIDDFGQEFSSKVNLYYEVSSDDSVCYVNIGFRVDNATEANKLVVDIQPIFIPTNIITQYPLTYKTLVVFPEHTPGNVTSPVHSLGYTLNSMKAANSSVETKANAAQTKANSAYTLAQTKQDQLTAGDNITIVDNVISSTGGSTGTGNVSTDGLTTGYLTKAVDAEKIGNSIFTEDHLSKDEDILYSLLDGLLTYKCDGTTVTNGVTKKANKMVTTAYSVTSIATGAMMDIEHGDPFLITSDAAKMAGQMLLDDADMTNADSHGGWIAGSTNLTVTTLPSTAYAFSYAQFFKGCTNLKNVYFSPGGLELITSMYQMFKDCTNGPAYFYGGEPCAATNWQGTFANSGVTLIDLTGSGCAGLTTMSRFAENCKSLEALNLTNFNFGTSDCSLMLSGCVSLKHLTLKGAKTEGISVCFKMFYNCEKLVTLDFGTASVPVSRNCEYMFDGCKALTTLDVSTFLPASIEYCHNMFANCTSINSLALPTGWCNTVDLGYMVALSQSSIAAIATALASGVKDRVITFDATIYAAIPATVLTTISDKGWTITTVTY